jgi:hypothetical protein
MSELPDERRYGDYELESFLGKGSIGRVYLAHHRRIRRRVALKTVHVEHKFDDDDERDEFYRRLQREAELFAKMQHPNIVTLYDVGYDDDDRVSYLATEYIDGESLLARLKRTRPLPVPEALAIGFDLLRGLAYAHSKDIIHRDIKPANILLTSEGQAKIADFGVARPFHSSLTSARSLVGTPSYMSPEQVRTIPVSPRSDLFSAGAVIYEMLTGTKPFASPELGAILYNVVNLVPPLASEVNPAIPLSVALVIAKLLEKKPEDRYENATDALAALDLASRDDTGAASTVIDRGAETIAVTAHDEATTPLSLRIDDVKRAGIPTAVFLAIPTLMIVALAIFFVTMRSKIANEKPTAVITAEQLRENATKEQALINAHTLSAAGRYDEAIFLYDEYLGKYPQSVAARDERAEAVRQRDEAEAAKSRITVTRKQTHRREPEPEPEPSLPAAKPPSRWQRIKRWFKGK